jgi:hypothetical protein
MRSVILHNAFRLGRLLFSPIIIAVRVKAVRWNGVVAQLVEGLVRKERLLSWRINYLRGFLRSSSLRKPLRKSAASANNRNNL